jgi:hypothetical protein
MKIEKGRYLVLSKKDKIHGNEYNRDDVHDQVYTNVLSVFFIKFSHVAFRISIYSEVCKCY